MKKRYIIWIVLIVLLLVACILVTIKTRNIVDKTEKEIQEKEINEEYIVLKKYKEGTDKVIKEIKINDKDEVLEISNLINKIEPLKDEEQVNLALLNEYVIEYKDIRIGFNSNYKYYCTYNNTMSKLPLELYNLIMSKFNNGISYYALQTHEYYEKDSNMKYVLKTKEELDRFYKKYSTAVNVDKDKFNNYYVLIVMQPQGSGSVKANLNGVSIKNNKPIFDIKWDYPEIGTDDMALWYFVAYIPRSYNNLDLSEYRGI